MKPTSAVAGMKKLTILALILAVPGFLYYLLTVKGKNRYKPLPVYGPKAVAKTFHKFHGKVIFDTIYHKLPDFELTDQDGKKVNFDTLAGKVLVVSFFYTRCPQMCEKVNVNLDSVARDYTRNKLTRFISITIDPEHDNAGVLKSYSAHLKPNTNWKFLTGDTAVIYNLARNGLLVNDFKAPGGDFIYNDKVMLVDAERRIRGYYSGTSLSDMLRLNDELKVQISEELRKIKSPEM